MHYIHPYINSYSSCCGEKMDRTQKEDICADCKEPCYQVYAVLTNEDED